MSHFTGLYNLRNLVKQKICFKNPKNPSCTDQNNSVFKTGLSDFHKFATAFPNLKAKVINSRDYRKLCNDEFRAKCDFTQEIKAWYKQHGIPTFP